MNKPKRCKECRHLGDYTSGVWSRNPHYCCELIWRLFEEDHKVNPDTVDSRCPLNDERIESYINEKLNKGKIEDTWEVDTDCEGKTRTLIHTKCGFKSGRYQWDNFDYCPKCGMKMRGNEDAV